MFSEHKESGVVLVVDDDQGVRAVIKAILTEGGYEVITAPDGVTACQLMQEYSGTIGLVITDVTMPNMDGLEFARRLKVTHPDLPVLLISAALSGGIRDDLGERVRFMEKPFALREFLAMVRSALNRSWFSSAHGTTAA